MPRLQSESPPLAERRKQQDPFRESEPFPDAHSRASSERKVGEFGPARCLREPSLRGEFEWLGKPASIAMDYPRAHRYDGPHRNRVAANLEIHESAPADSP